MATPGEVVPVPESPAFASTPREKDRDEVSHFQEINERRARVENAELLAHLRGL